MRSHRHCMSWLPAYNNLALIYFTEQCNAERCYATVCRLSVRPSVRVCPSVTFRNRDRIGWNTSNTISRLISLNHADPNIIDLVQQEHPKIRPESGWGHEHKSLQYLWNGAR